MSNNRFGLLADVNDPDGPDMICDAEQKVKRPPPIEITGEKLENVKNEFAKIKNLTDVIQYRISVMRLDKSQVKETVKVYTQSEGDFKLTLAHLKTTKLQYNTHPLHSDKKTKVCLYGLNEVSVDDIKRELTVMSKIETSEVKMIKPKNSAVENRIYILYYKKSDRIKVADLREAVTGIFHMRVRFEYYSPRKNGPTQCG